MKTIDLTLGERTPADPLDPARHERLPIHSGTGEVSLPETADDLDREVALLGQSERFMGFLHDRSREAAGTPVGDTWERRGQRVH